MTRTNQDAPEFFVSTSDNGVRCVTFYKVLKRTAKTVTLIEVKKKIERADFGYYYARPTDEPTEGAKPMRKRLDVNEFGRARVWVKEFSCARRWNGEAVEGWIDNEQE